MVEFVSRSTVKLYRAAAEDIDVARAAWASQDGESHRKEKEPGRVEGLINFLWGNDRDGLPHTSPFEHGQYTFIVETPIFVAREFMRHRTFSYNEISGRYTVLPLKFYIPDTDVRPLQQTGKVGSYKFETGTRMQRNVVNSLTRLACERSAAAYESMLDAGVAKEVARNVLPVNTMTTFWATCNPLNLMKFLDLRTAPDALYEIREVAGEMERHFAEAQPNVYKAWKRENN